MVYPQARRVDFDSFAQYLTLCGVVLSKQCSWKKRQNVLFEPV